MSNIFSLMETNLRLLSQYKYTYTSNMFTDLTMSIETKWSKLVRQIKDDDKEDIPDVDIIDFSFEWNHINSIFW